MQVEEEVSKVESIAKPIVEESEAEVIPDIEMQEAQIEEPEVKEV